MASDEELSDFAMNDDAGFEEDDMASGYESSNPSDAPSDAEYDDEDDDMAFSTGDLDKAKKGKFEVEYKIHDVKDIIARQQKEIDHISGLFELKSTDAAILLRHYDWNKERLIERYMENPDAVLTAAGLAPSTSTSTPSPTSPTSSPEQGTRHLAHYHPRLKRIKGFVCEICCQGGEGEFVQTLALSCGHRFCSDCWRGHFEEKIRGQGESKKIECMEADCSAVVDEKTVEMLVSSETFNRYNTLLNRTYVEDNRRGLKYCPGPDCENVIECQVRPSHLDTTIPIVHCACGQMSCFGCGCSADHRPAICGITKLWLKKCEDDSETANWISANTKECPKCHSTIEKNGGCNHMTCKKCKDEFCWVCMGPWSEHGNNWYNCNRFDEKSGSDARDGQTKSRASLERYLHYYNRFANHEQSAKLDRELYAKTEKKMEEMQRSSSLTWIEVQFAKKAVEAVTKCRMTLKWTYAMAFYLERNSMTELFEDNQRDLERAVEQLSELLEKPIEPETIPQLRQQVLDATNYVENRNAIVMDDTLSGHQEGRWTYVDWITIPRLD